MLLSPGRPQSHRQQSLLHLDQGMKSKACAQDFAVKRDLEGAPLIAQGVIMYLMQTSLPLTCTQIKCSDFAKWLWWTSVPSCLWC